MTARISRTDMAQASPAHITDSKIIASYNWQANDPKKFLSPGFPPLLRENERAVQLQKDTEEDFVDETFLRNEQYPNEVIFRAVEVCDPEFSWSDIRIVTTRSTLRRLLGFLTGSEEAFVFYIDRVGNHCVFTRTRSTADMYSGYGHYFEKVNTYMDRTRGDPKGFDHILSYRLGGVKLVVTAEVDAVQPKFPTDPMGGRPAAHQQNAVLEWVSRDGSKLQHAKVGSLISHRNHRIYEMKTVSQVSCMKDRWESYYYQMILGGVDSLLRGIHYRGRIQKRERYTSDQIRNLITSCDTELTLGKLSLLLETIMSKVDQMDPNKGHQVFRLEYVPGDREIVFEKMDQDCSKIPDWIVKKLQSD